MLRARMDLLTPFGPASATLVASPRKSSVIKASITARSLFWAAHDGLPKRAQALATEDIYKLVATCADDLIGLRERAILLVEFVGAPGAVRTLRNRGCAHHLEDAQP